MKLIYAAILFFAVAVLQAQDVVTPVSGGLARTVALGGGPTNPYVLDYTDVFTNPAHAFTYKDLLYGDIGYNFAQYSASGQYLGVTLAINNFAVGIAIGKREGPMFFENSYFPSSTFAGSDYMIAGLANIWGIAQTEPKTPIQVFGAYKIENLTVGAALYRSGWSRVDDRMGMATLTQKYEMSHYQTGLKLGAIYEISPEQKIEGALLARLNSSFVEMNDASTTVTPTSRTYSANGYEFALNVRGFISLNEKLELVPQGRFAFFTYTPEYKIAPAPAQPYPNKPNEYSKMEYELGAAINSKFQGGWVSVGLSVQNITLTNNATTLSGTALVTTDNSISWFDLPKVNIGCEIEVLSWLKGRLGYFKRLSTQTTTTGPTSLELSIGGEPGYVPNLGLSSASQQLSMGLGISISRISIDGLVGERFFAAGPNILSGNVQDMFGILSVSVKL